jgi:hypothetical protein
VPGLRGARAAEREVPDLFERRQHRHERTTIPTQATD